VLHQYIKEPIKRKQDTKHLIDSSFLGLAGEYDALNIYLDCSIRSSES